MFVRPLRVLLGLPHKLAMLRLSGLLRSQGRMLALMALVEAGVLARLSEPRGLDELSGELGPHSTTLLRALLGVAVETRDLAQSEGRYRLRSRLARALAAPNGEPLTSMLSEAGRFHASVFRDLPQRLRDGEPGAYLDEFGLLVAEASRVVEPLIGDFVERLAPAGRGLEILEIGCGSGVYVERYLGLDPRHRGVAIDLDGAVIKRARQRLMPIEGSERFKLVHADIREPGAELDGPFELVTAFQNIYYFSDVERQQLFAHVRARLAGGGRFAIVSPFEADGFLAHYFGVILASTRGCHPLPALQTVRRELLEAGFESLEVSRLMPGDSIWAVVAS